MSQVLSPAEQLELVNRSVSAAHVKLLRDLPIMVDGGDYVFVHAGIRPGVALGAQTERDLMFIRSEFFDQAHRLRTWIVHGHTPVAEARLDGRRLNIDTGAYNTGRLSAVRILDGQGRILTT